MIPPCQAYSFSVVARGQPRETVLSRREAGQQPQRQTEAQSSKGLPDLASYHADEIQFTFHLIKNVDDFYAMTPFMAEKVCLGRMEEV